MSTAVGSPIKDPAEGGGAAARPVRALLPLDPSTFDDVWADSG